jgi:multidrug efflux pump subunit AcrA (membrane-fusion protein)
MAPSTAGSTTSRTKDRLSVLFDDSAEAESSTRWWQRKHGRIALGVVAAFLVSVLVATQAFGSEGNQYRTATAATRDVDAIQSGAATIEPVSQATVAFPVSGTVASVAVKVGDTVTVGTTLASLDPQTLTETLHEKQASLAQAQLNLQKALSGEAVTGAPSGGGSGVSGSATAAGASFSSSTASGVQLVAARTTVLAASTDPAIAAAQQAVLQAQQEVDAALATASSALSNATAVCADVAGDPSTAPACQAAIDEVLTAQTAVQDAQNTLADAMNTLDTLLQQQADAAPTTPSTSPSDGSAPSGGPSLSGGPSGGGATSPSAADLVSYQKAIDAAAAEVSVAEQALAQASIATPIEGTVVAVNLEVGDSVTADSTTANIVVQGDGGYEVSTTVGIDRVADVSVGQQATFTPDGSHKTLDGKVAFISVVPSSTSTTTSYTVVVGLSNSKVDLDNGSTGTVRIVTESAKSALAVPTSAVSANGSRHSVEVVNGADTTRVSVKVGVVGDTWTEIKSGIDAGQEVVLANLSEPLPGSATNSSSSTQGGGFPGGFPGGGAGGGGFPRG